VVVAAARGKVSGAACRPAALRAYALFWCPKQRWSKYARRRPFLASSTLPISRYQFVPFPRHPFRRTPEHLVTFSLDSSRDWQAPVLEQKRLGVNGRMWAAAMGVPCFPRLLPQGSFLQWSDGSRTPENPECTSSGAPCSRYGPGSPRLVSMDLYLVGKPRFLARRLGPPENVTVGS
jgi:hypothetical protein